MNNTEATPAPAEVSEKSNTVAMVNNTEATPRFDWKWFLDTTQPCKYEFWIKNLNSYALSWLLLFVASKLGVPFSPGEAFTAILVTKTLYFFFALLGGCMFVASAAQTYLGIFSYSNTKAWIERNQELEAPLIIIFIIMLLLMCITAAASQFAN